MNIRYPIYEGVYRILTFIGKTLYPTAPCKRAFENGNDRPAAHHRPKGKNNKVGLYG